LKLFTWSRNEYPDTIYGPFGNEEMKNWFNQGYFRNSDSISYDNMTDNYNSSYYDYSYNFDNNHDETNILNINNNNSVNNNILVMKYIDNIPITEFIPFLDSYL
jgi:hypothetical protein